MGTANRTQLSTHVGSDGASSGEILEALAQYFSDLNNIRTCLTILRKAVEVVVSPYVAALGSAYRSVYRRPAPHNCTALMKLEAKPPRPFFVPHTYYEKMRDRLIEGFTLLDTHPIFANASLRRDLSKLQGKTLTLFFTPQLIRPRVGSANPESLLDATSSLVKMRNLHFSAALYFLRRSLRPKERGYNPTLLTNLAFLAYRRFENARLSGANTRTERRHLDAIIARARRHSARSRVLVGRKLTTGWSGDAEAPEVLEEWAAMVAGKSSYETRVLARRLR